MSTWWPPRRWTALLVLALATVTAVAAVARGAAPWQGVAYVGVAAYGLITPAAIAVQVVLGLVLVAGLLAGAPGDPLALLPLVVAVVATSELLGVAARLDVPIRRGAADLQLRAGLNALLAGGVFGAAILVLRLPTPSGLAAVALASGAVLVVALLLVRTAAPGEGPRPRPGA